jgi:hypothetical protein
MGSPEYDTPTYNLRPIFEKAMNWDYEQGKYYPLNDVVEHVRHGIYELNTHKSAYKKLEPSNGWGSVEDALEVLKSILDCIYPEKPWQRMFDEDIPINCMYMRW